MLAIVLLVHYDGEIDNTYYKDKDSYEPGCNRINSNGHFVLIRHILKVLLVLFELMSVLFGMDRLDVFF